MKKLYGISILVLLFLGVPFMAFAGSENPEIDLLEAFESLAILVDADGEWRNVATDIPYKDAEWERTRSIEYWERRYALLGCDEFQYQPPGTPPKICVAGFWDTRVSTGEPGYISMLALVTDADGDLDRVEIMLNGGSVGISLFDDGEHGDVFANDGIFAVQIPVGPIGPFNLNVELVAFDRVGNASDVWPWLTIR